MFYQHDTKGYFLYETPTNGYNCTTKKPILQEGFIPRWTGKEWEQIENHKNNQVKKAIAAGRAIILRLTPRTIIKSTVTEA